MFPPTNPQAASAPHGRADSAFPSQAVPVDSGLNSAASVSHWRTKTQSSGPSGFLGSLSVMSDPVQWSRAQLSWSSHGYVLRAPIRLEERAAHECRAELASAIRAVLVGHDVVSITASPMEITRSATGASSEPGELEIVTSRMIDSEEAVELRDAVLQVLRSAVEETDRVAGEDKQSADLILAALRQAPA